MMMMAVKAAIFVQPKMGKLMFNNFDIAFSDFFPDPARSTLALIMRRIDKLSRPKIFEE